MPIIEVENLSKKFTLTHESPQRYQSMRDVISEKVKSIFFNKKKEIISTEDFWALRDVSFTVEAGDRVGIIGRNGAGKSTLLKILSRITPPTSGKISIRGRVSSLLEVGTGFHPELTGRENIFLNGAILGMSRAEIQKKFDEIVDFAEVEKFLDTPVKRYSSGMYVRLAFAVAAHLESEILIIDEVLAVGDAQFQQKCLGKMEDISNSNGRTLLFVSHNLEALRNLCTNGVILNEGKVDFKGTITECLGFYKNNQVKGANNVWKIKDPKGTPHFSYLELNISGVHPEIKLEIRFTVELGIKFKPCFVAFDIENGIGNTIMQALPTINPFIYCEDPNNQYLVEINIKGLIPDQYSISAWLGPHNSETYDWLQKIITFEITESPTIGRTVPHDYRNGFFVPESKIINKYDKEIDKEHFY